jgi:hypothetical protein
MWIIVFDVVSIDFRILFGKLKPDEKPQNIIAAFLSVLAKVLTPLKLLGTLLKDAFFETLADLLEKNCIPYFVLASALKRFAKSYGIGLNEDTFYIDGKYQEYQKKELPAMNKMLHISASIENIDAKKLVALAQAKAPTNTAAKVNIAAVLSAIEPQANDILNALIPALPDVVSALNGYIKEEAEKRFGITLSDLKVSQ